MEPKFKVGDIVKLIINSDVEVMILEVLRLPDGSFTGTYNCRTATFGKLVINEFELEALEE